MSKIFFQEISKNELISELKQENAKLLTAAEERIQDSVREELRSLLEVIDRKITTKEAARILKCDPQTVRKHEKAGVLENAGQGRGQFRFWLSDVLELKQNWRKYKRNFTQ